MTAPDPRSRPNRASETPLDGTATARTDATVRPHDADTPDAPDALDAWLESITANGERSIGHVSINGNGSSPHRAGVNGSGPGESDTSLVATARLFHARIANAEASHTTGSPEATLEAIIWERIMSSQFSQITAQQPAVIQGRIPPAGTVQPGQQEEDAGHPAPVIDRFTGGHPAISAVLAAAVLLAIVAIFRMVGAPPSGPTDDPSSGSNSSTNPALAAASPNASPVASPMAGDDRWLVDPNTVACTVDPANPPGTVAEGWIGFAPNGGLLPLSETSPINQTAAAEVYLQFRICHVDDSATDVLVSDAFAEVLTAEGSDIPPEQQALARQVSDAYAGKDPMSYVIEGDPLPTSTSSPGSFAGESRRVLLPDDIVQLADGRIGGPAHVFFRTNDPTGTASHLGLPAFLETGFVIFTAEDGRWVIDDYLQICIGDCDTYWASRDVDGTPALAPAAIAPATPAAAPAGTPISQAATPATPESGTLLIDTGSAIVSRPLDGTPGATLATYDQADPPIYTRTTVPDVVMGSDGMTAHNVRTGQVLGTNPYESATVIGPFWVQYTFQNPAVPVDARIVDLRTMKSVGFFDLAGIDPAGLGPQWLIEGTESGTLGVGFIDRAEATGPILTPTMLLIDGDLQHTRAVPLWSPPGPNSDVLAFSPDGSLVTYLTGTEGNVTIRVETIAGEPIGDIPWPGGTPVAHMVLPDAQTLLVMSEGRVLRVDLAAGTVPAPIAGYPDEIWNTVLSADGTHLLFATLDPLSGSDDNMAWHWLDIGTGEVQPIPQATGANQVWPGPSRGPDTVMLWVPVGPLGNATYRVLFVEMTTGAVTEGHPTGVTSGLAPGEPISEDAAVFAAYGIGSPDAPRYRIHGPGSIPLSGQLVVFDAASRSVVEIPFPDAGIPSEIIEPAIIVSPDGRHVVLSVRWTDGGDEHAQSWITTADGRSGWAPVEGGMVVGWVGE